MIRELHLKRAGTLAWAEREPPAVVDPGDAIVRPFLAGRCDGDTLPIHRPVSRAMQLGIAVRAIDPVVACICGKVPFKGPFAIGHEGVAEVVAVGPQVTNVRVGQAVVVPWAVSCGGCARCRQGLTSKCATTTNGALAAFGFGPASGPWGGMICDELRVPYADHMLVPVPRGVPAERVAAAGDNLADAWRSVVPPLAQRPGGSVLVIGGGGPWRTGPRASTTSTTPHAAGRSLRRSAPGPAHAARRNGPTTSSPRPPRARRPCAARCVR
jgi:threonine dehydrogenase-like Zn-dependent dehydrogenase